MQEREIDLIDFVFDVLLGWRKALFAVLIGAVVLGAFGGYRVYRAANADMNKIDALNEQISLLEEEEKVIGTDEYRLLEQRRLEKDLTEVQKANVHNVCISEKQLHDKEDYAENTSLYTRLNCNAIPKAETVFYINAADLSLAHDIEKAYEDILVSGELVNWICDKNKEFTAADIVESFRIKRSTYTSTEGSSTVTSNIIYPDRKGCEKLAEMLVTFVEDQHDAMVNKVGEHEIYIINQSIIEVADLASLNQQKSIQADIIANATSIAKLKDAFSKEEWKYYESITGKDCKDKYEDGTDKEQLSDKEKLIEERDRLIERTHFRPNVKYTIFGACLGGIIFAGIMFLQLIFNCKLQANDNLERMYDIPVLGSISKECSKKRLFDFVDRFILSLKYRNKRSFAKDTAILLAVSSIKAVSQKKGVQNIILAGSGIDKPSLDICEQVVQLLQKEDIDIKVINNLLYDASSLDVLKNVDGVVILGVVGETLYDEIGEEINLLDRLGIEKLGGIVIA